MAARLRSKLAAYLLLRLAVVPSLRRAPGRVKTFARPRARGFARLCHNPGVVRFRLPARVLALVLVVLGITAILIFLLVRPQGIFGERISEKA